jgi:perosamine synthetase
MAKPPIISTSEGAAEDFIPLCVPNICGNEWRYIKECLDTGWVSSVGSFVDRFERMVADYIGAKYAVATVNGTAALHVALQVAGVRPDDEVLVPALTFIAPANAVRYVGAWPIFMDAEPEYWQMDPQKMLDFLEIECHWREGALYNKTTKRRVKAILPVHILGHPVDMDPLVDLAGKYNLAIIDDATESLGAEYKGRKVGNLGNISCFSFNGNKIITTGGGGMIVTNDEREAQKAKYLTTQAKDDPVEFIHGEIGFNYRLTNVLAAMGVAQMEVLDSFIARKREIAASYSQALGMVEGLTLMKQAPWARSTHWMYTILIRESEFGMSSRELLAYLANQRIETRPLWQPLHRSPAHLGCQSFRVEVADRLHHESLSLPCSSGSTDAALDRVQCLLKAAARENRQGARYAWTAGDPGRAAESVLTPATDKQLGIFCRADKKTS